MTPERLAELQRLCDAATLGPWDDGEVFWPGASPERRSHVFHQQGNSISSNPNDHEVCIASKKNDAAFIAAARTALPEALAEIERLRSGLKTMWEWLERNDENPRLSADQLLSLLLAKAQMEALGLKP